MSCFVQPYRVFNGPVFHGPFWSFMCLYDYMVHILSCIRNKIMYSPWRSGGSVWSCFLQSCMLINSLLQSCACKNLVDLCNYATYILGLTIITLSSQSYVIMLANKDQLCENTSQYSYQKFNPNQIIVKGYQQKHKICNKQHVNCGYKLISIINILFKKGILALGFMVMS